MVNPELQRLENEARTGDKMKGFLKDGAYALLNEVILEPMERGAFESFKKVPASDSLAVAETQMMSKVIDKIRREIENKISQGDFARQQLLTYSNPEETDE